MHEAKNESTSRVPVNKVFMWNCMYTLVRYRRGEPRVRVPERVGPALRQTSGHVRAGHRRAAVSASSPAAVYPSFSQLSPTSCPLKHCNRLPPEVYSAPEVNFVNIVPRRTICDCNASPLPQTCNSYQFYTILFVVNVFSLSTRLRNPFNCVILYKSTYVFTKYLI